MFPARYRSSGFKDELCEGAMWLYRVTNNVQYLEDAKSNFQDLWAWALSWDDKKIACQVFYISELQGALEVLPLIPEHLRRYRLIPDYRKMLREYLPKLREIIKNFFMFAKAGEKHASDDEKFVVSGPLLLTLSSYNYLL